MKILNDAELREELLNACIEAGSRQAWAKKHGIVRVYVGYVLMGKKKPTPEMLKALGYEFAGYRKIKGLKKPKAERRRWCRKFRL
jgi:hypothetical protein